MLVVSDAESGVCDLMEGMSMDAKRMLDRVVKQAGILSHAKVVWIVYPLLEQIASAYVEFVNVSSKTQTNRPLAQHVIKNAILRYINAQENGVRPDTAFVGALLDSGKDVFSQQVVVEMPDGDVLWSPFECGLSDFLRQHADRGIRISYNPTNIRPEISRVFLMLKIMPASLLMNEAALLSLIDGVESD